MAAASRQKVLIYEQTVKSITEYIAAQHLTTGDKLPAERELAKLFGVSRSCVREALHILAVNDYIQIKRSSGAYVNLPSLPENFQLLENLEDKLNLQKLQELLEARRLLETYAIKQAAKIITQEQLQKLYDMEAESYESMLDEAKKGGKPFGRPSIILEHMIVQVQPNQYITEFHRKICAAWWECLDTYNLVTMPPAKRHRDHMAILRAVSENNEAKISRYISIHLMDTYDNITSMLTESKEEQ